MGTLALSLYFVCVDLIFCSDLSLGMWDLCSSLVSCPGMIWGVQTSSMNDVALSVLVCRMLVSNPERACRGVRLRPQRFPVLFWECVLGSLWICPFWTPIVCQILGDLHCLLVLLVSVSLEVYMLCWVGWWVYSLLDFLSLPFWRFGPHMLLSTLLVFSCLSMLC